MEDVWTNKILQEKIKEIGFNSSKNINSNIYISDRKEKSDFFKLFAPPIRAIGYDVAKEASNKKWYSGILYNLVESEDKKERMLQILMIWTKQRAFMSSYFALVFTLISLFSIIQISSAKIVTKEWVEYSIVLITAYLIFYLLYYIIRAIFLGDFSYRLAIGFMGIPYYIYSMDDLNLKLSGNGNEVFSANGFEIFLSFTALLFFGIALGFLILRFLEDNKGLKQIEDLLAQIYQKRSIPLLGHSMDYAPIWVRLKKTINSNDQEIISDPVNWTIDRIYYDRGHYSIDSFIFKDPLDQSPIFEIRNRWHSFNLAYISNILPKFAKKLIIIGTLVLLGIISICFWGNNYLILIQSFLWIILIMASVSFYNSHEFHFTRDFIDNYDLTNENNFLDDGKLDILWNFELKIAQLKIKKKISDSFLADYKNGNWEVERINAVKRFFASKYYSISKQIGKLINFLKRRILFIKKLIVL